MNHLYEYLAPYTMQNIRCSSQDISGDITVPDSGVVYVSLPNFNGWTACVDGEAVEIQSFLGGMGIPVEEGTHQITLHYSTPGLGIGIPISLIALLVFAAMLIWLRKNKKKAIFSTTE
jgi:uncharacterized membrane protein YfhO